MTHPTPASASATVSEAVPVLPGMRRLAEGDVVELMMPASEVCMHLLVVDHVRTVQVLSHGAQLLDGKTGDPWSIPITHGEAGIIRRDGHLYAPELPEQLWQVEHDGKRISPRMANDLTCMGWLHRHKGSSSVDHAIAHEGYAIVPVNTADTSQAGEKPDEVCIHEIHDGLCGDENCERCVSIALAADRANATAG